MSRAQRDKGNAGEREVVNVAQVSGFPDARRSGDAGQWDHHCEDVVGVPGVRLAVKRQETLRISEWAKEVEDEAHDFEIPALAFRRSREPWRVVIPLSDFLSLLRRRR